VAVIDGVGVAVCVEVTAGVGVCVGVGLLVGVCVGVIVGVGVGFGIESTNIALASPFRNSNLPRLNNIDISREHFKNKC
jgi:hypothetical protein